MNRRITILFPLLFILLFVHVSSAQSLSVSFPVIFSKVKATNNWSTSTAVSRKNQFEGTALGYGSNLVFSFHPGFVIKNKNIYLLIGAGYFNQAFNIERPFDYASPLQPIFYTDKYSYQCWQWMAGITYDHPLSEKLKLSGSLSYTGLHSFKQLYTPTSNHGYGHLTQVNTSQMDFGKMVNLGIGVKMAVHYKWSVGMEVITPLYTRWRNDKIFKDDTSTYSNPNFSLGTALSLLYHFKS